MVWSPRGRYLACFHRLGIILWGGPSWKKLSKFGQEGVKLLDFSPSERFIVTWSPLSPPTASLLVWDIASGALLRAFAGPKDLATMQWPLFRCARPPGATPLRGSATPAAPRAWQHSTSPSP